MAEQKNGLQVHLEKIESKLGGETKVYRDLGQHLEYIESLIDGGSGGDIPTPSAGDEGKVPSVKDDLSGFEYKEKADLINGKVPAEELPSYVDDILEYDTLSDFPNPGEEGKIYVAKDTGYTYRWSGTQYTQVGGQDLSNFVLKSLICDLYDNTKTYVVGNLVINGDCLYSCIVPISSPEDFDSSKWREVTIAELLSEKVSNAHLNIDCYAPLGDSTELSNISIQVKDSKNNIIASGTYNGDTLSFSLPVNQIYKIEVLTQSLTVESITYFAPEVTSGSAEGTLTQDSNVIYRYSSTQSINSLSAVKQFLALPDIDIATKRLALVRTETNSFSVDIKIKNPENNTEYTMPIYIVEIDNYVKKVDGVNVSFLGAKCQFAYALPDSIAFDEREQIECESGETFQDGIFYYTATSSGVGDKSFTPLVAGTDYQNGDDIDTYKSTNNVYVFKHAWSNTQYGSGNKSTANLIRYGSNIYHESNIDKWLNGMGVDWFVASHLGDRLATWYNGKHGFKDWFDNATLSLIEDNVAYGVYEIDGATLTDNKIYRMFVLPSGTEMAGSVNNNEGTVLEYWKYLNGGVVDNSANANRTVKKITNISSAQNTWFRSPYRDYSYYAWSVHYYGRVTNYNAYNGCAVLPTFTI